MLAFFLSVVRFLEATFFATFFFVRELGFFAPIAVATLSHATPGAAVAVAAAETAAAAAALASSPVRVLVLGGTFGCGYNSFLRTRFDALPRHIPLPRGPRRNIVRVTISLWKRSRVT